MPIKRTIKQGKWLLAAAATLLLPLAGCSGAAGHGQQPSLPAQVTDAPVDPGPDGTDGAEAAPTPEAASQPESSSQPETGGQDSGPSGEEISLEEAQGIALDHAQVAAEEASFVKSKREREDGRAVYELEFYTGSHEAEYEYEIDAATGEILSCKWEFSRDGAPVEGGVTADQAKEQALALVPGAEPGDIREFETDREHGHTEYEGKIVYEGMEYEFKIDADTGIMLEWDMESAGRHS